MKLSEEEDDVGTPRINRRHYLDQISGRDRSARKTTYILPEYRAAVEADLRLIAAGQASRDHSPAGGGNTYRINERTYVDKGNGTFFPKAGPGFITVERGVNRAIILLALYNGPTEAALHRLRHEPLISDADIEQALQLWALRTR